MTILPRTEYLARFGDMRERLFNCEKVGRQRFPVLCTAFRDDLGWPIVPLPDSFSSVCSGPISETDTAALVRDGGILSETEGAEEGARAGQKHDALLERIWHPLFDLLGRIGEEMLVGVSMWDNRVPVEGKVQDFIRYEMALADGQNVARPETQGELREDQHAIEFPNDWSRLREYLNWDERSMDDNVVFDRTLTWGIHSWEEEPYSFFSAPREPVEVYLEAIGGVGVLRRDLDWFVADNEESYGFTERFNAFVAQPPFVTAGLASGYSGP